MQDSPSSPFDQLVCSGGGTRCCWQGGWLHVVRDRIGLAPARISGVSGGAGTAAGFIARRGEAFIDALCEAFAKLDSNIDPHETDETGLTPHQSIYRGVIREVFDEAATRQIAEGPPFQVLLGHPPSHDWPRLSGTAATLAYEAELHTVGSPHFNWAERIGVTTTLVDARAAARAGTLAHLIQAAAVIPPVFEPLEWDGKPVIDGGMADQAPMPQPDSGRTLVLLTRHYKGKPDLPGRHYVEPTEEPDTGKIDFTDPDKIRRAWDAGMEDGRDFLENYLSDINQGDQ